MSSARSDRKCCMSPPRLACEERSGDLHAVLLRHLEARPRGADVGAGAAGELAAGGRLAADRGGDLVEADAEDVVEEEGGALERRKPLEREHQRQRDLVDRYRLPPGRPAPAATDRRRSRGGGGRISAGPGRGASRRGAGRPRAPGLRRDRRPASGGTPPGPRPPRPRRTRACGKRRGSGSGGGVERGCRAVVVMRPRGAP